MRKERAAIFYFLRVAIPIVGFGGTFAVVTALDHPGSLDFYKSAATVIPTLLLTLAVQGRFFRLSDIVQSPLYQALKGQEITHETLKGLGVPRWPAWMLVYSVRLSLAQFRRNTHVYTLLLLLTIAAGEGCALYVVTTGATSAGLLGIVVATMVSAFLGIAVIAMVGVQVESPRESSEDDQTRQGWAQVAAELTLRRQEGQGADATRPGVDASFR